MVTREVPVSTILVNAQSVAGGEMAFEHLTAPPAFQANDIIAMDRSPDRHRGCSLDAGFCYRFAKPRECLMNGRDQSGELVGPYLIAPNISRHNFSGELSIK